MTTGFIPYYNWAQNRQSCIYKKIAAVPPGSRSINGRYDNTTSILFEARRGSGNIVVSCLVTAQQRLPSAWHNTLCCAWHAQVHVCHTAYAVAAMLLHC
jgi:hypothetical protein